MQEEKFNKQDGNLVQPNVNGWAGGLLKSKDDCKNEAQIEETGKAFDVEWGGEFTRIVNVMERAMDIYALQFIHSKDCYQCDGTGTVVFPSKATQQCMICKGTGKLIILPMQQNT